MKTTPKPKQIFLIKVLDKNHQALLEMKYNKLMYHIGNINNRIQRKLKLSDYDEIYLEISTTYKNIFYIIKRNIFLHELKKDFNQFDWFVAHAFHSMCIEFIGKIIGEMSIVFVESNETITTESLRKLHGLFRQALTKQPQNFILRVSGMVLKKHTKVILFGLKIQIMLANGTISIIFQK